MKILCHSSGWLDSWVESNGLIEATWRYLRQREMLLALETGFHMPYSMWVVLLSSVYILGFLDKER